MINYMLRCAGGHSFEGWFRSIADFDDQAEKGLLACPFCSSAKVEKAIMAPAIAKNEAAPTVGQGTVEEAAAGNGTAQGPTASPKETKSEVLPPSRAVAKPPTPPSDAQTAKFWLMMRAVQQHVEKNFENVGKKFPDEVRKMHVGETEHREVYGEATLEEAKELLEEGIEVMPLPKLPKLDG